MAKRRRKTGFKRHIPISTKYYYASQLAEYRAVKKKHGVTYAKKWFYAKHER